MGPGQTTSPRQQQAAEACHQWMNSNACLGLLSCSEAPASSVACLFSSCSCRCKPSAIAATGNSQAMDLTAGKLAGTCQESMTTCGVLAAMCLRLPVSLLLPCIPDHVWVSHCCPKCRHLPRIYDYLWVAEDGLKMQGYNGSQLWDTSFATQAIISTGLLDVSASCLRKAHTYIRNTQQQPKSLAATDPVMTTAG
eukprot:scaffold111165_cov20-Tisochrysis_lutea.AAC.7